MELRSARYGNVVVLGPQGRIDHLNAEAFGHALAPHVERCSTGGEPLLLELSALEYISSAGLRVLMLASKRIVPAGGRLGVAAPKPLVREILEISRFDLVFPVYDTLDAALAGLAPAAGA